MDNTKKLLEKARKRCEPRTWYELAKRLGVSRFRVSNWTRGKHRPDPESALKIADLLNLDRVEVLAMIEADRGANRPQSDFWGRLTPRVLPAATLGMTLALAGHSGERVDRAFSHKSLNDLYIMRTGRRLQQWLDACRARGCGFRLIPARG